MSILNKDLNILKEDTNKLSDLINININNGQINILPFFLNKFNNLKEIERNKTLEAIRIKKILF